MKKLFTEGKMISAELKKRQKFNEKINQFATLLKEDKVTLSSDILVGFYNEGVVFLKEHFLRKAMGDLKLKPGAVSGVIKDSLVQASTRTASRYSNLHYSLQIAYEGLGVSVEKITIQRGKALLTDEDKAQITEQYTYYLSSEDQELYTRIQGFLEVLKTEDRFLNSALGVSLKRILEWDDMGSATPLDTRLKTPRLRDDLPIIKFEGSFIANPAWFGARAKQS
jgi:hypothetical protein